MIQSQYVLLNTVNICAKNVMPHDVNGEASASYYFDELF